MAAGSRSSYGVAAQLPSCSPATGHQQVLKFGCPAQLPAPSSLSHWPFLEHHGQLDGQLHGWLRQQAVLPEAGSWAGRDSSSSVEVCVWFMRAAATCGQRSSNALSTPCCSCHSIPLFVPPSAPEVREGRQRTCSMLPAVQTTLPVHAAIFLVLQVVAARGSGCSSTSHSFLALVGTFFMPKRARAKSSGTFYYAKPCRATRVPGCLLCYVYYSIPPL